MVGFVFRWGTWAALALRASNATADGIGGVSTVVNSPNVVTGVVGQPFLLRITTTPYAANHFEAAPLPPGLLISASSGRITGVPTQPGFWDVRLTVADTAFTDRITTTNLALTILSLAPSISAGPSNQVAALGDSVSLGVVAGGVGALAYRWQKNGQDLPGANGAVLDLGRVTALDAGVYRVVVSSANGITPSEPATLEVLTPFAITGMSVSNGGFSFEALGPSNALYVVWSSPDLASWVPVRTNRLVDGRLLFTDGAGEPRPRGFYRVRVTKP
jgi:hypothetical protein